MARILAIDDKEDNLISVSAVLKSYIPGCTIITARSGPEGIEKAKLESPDTILLDIKIPGMDGYEICKRLKEDESTKRIPVIMISAILTGSKDLIKGLDTGADAYLAKPVDEQVLIAQVKTALRMKAAEDTLREQKDLLEEMVKQRTAELVGKNIKLGREIAERKQAEENMEKEFRMRSSLLDNIPDCIALILKKDSHEIVASNRFARELGAIPGQTCFKTCAMRDDSCPFCRAPKLWETGRSQRIEVEYREKWYEGIWEPLSDDLYVHYIFEITGRKQAEVSLRENEEKYRSLFEQSNDAIIIHGLKGDIIDFNQRALEIIGYDPEQLLNMTIAELHPEEELAVSKKAFQETTKKGSARFETRFRKSDGAIIDVEISSRIIGSVQKGVVQGLIRDITERKRDVEVLRQRTEELETVMDAIPAFVWMGLDPKCSIITGNRAASEMTATPMKSNVSQTTAKPGQALYIRQLKEDGSEYQPDELPMQRAIALGRPVRNVSITFRFEDGRQVDAFGGAVPLFDEEGQARGAVAAFLDVTEQKTLEKQLFQAQKVEAIGNLAGGIAHDFNNMLSIIIGYGENIFEKLHPGDPLREDVKEILEAGRRSAALTRQLLAFSRKQTLQPEVLDLNVLLNDLEKMLARLIGEDIELEMKLSKNLHRVLADPGQIEQVIMNLAVNSRDAMPDGGSLIIETVNTELDEVYASNHVSVTPGKYVMLTMTDNGSGMDKETLSQIFEPFFTTKEKEKGTGLGLSTVYGIVKQSGGNIWAYSEPGMGTTFKIYLPRTEAEPELKVKAAGKEERKGGGEHILVVEDDASLRRLCSRILLNGGYRITLAANGGEALLEVEEKGLRPDLVVTDVVMPGMSGKVLVDRLRKTMPELKVLYMSGYTDNAIVHHGVLDPGTPFIQKPFNTRDFGAKVQDVLRGGGGRSSPMRHDFYWEQ